MALLLTLTITQVWADGPELASWYGPGYYNRTMANGRPFDSQALTAATWLDLPLGTRVVLMSPCRAVVVELTDRMPRHPRIIVDVSEAAASQLFCRDFRQQGVTPVRIIGIVRVRLNLGLE